MCCPAPLKANRIRRAVQATAADIARHLQPRSAAYFEIWIDDAPLADSPLADPPLEHVEPIYGRTYLPRKFKIGIGLPDDNCVDVYTQDVGLLAIVEGTADQPQVTGYNVIVGGGLGMTPAVASTHPRLGDPMAFVPYGETLRVVNAIVEVQRDFGNRQDRRHARLKYLIERWGVQQFREHVQKYLGDLELDAHRPIEVTACDDHLGWQPQGDGKFFLGLPIDNGRIGDDQSLRRKTGLRRLLQRFHMPVRLTPQQNLLLCDLDAQCRQEVFDLLAEHGMPTADDISPLHRLALACPALPTCGLAITEAERVMPRLLAELDAELIRLGLDGQNITVRMTGCPNACARPYTADIGIVGKAAGRYTIYVGGGLLGTRLNFVYQEMVPFDEIVSRLRPLLQHYMADRQAGESLGDYCHRQGVKA
jgi:sulfite reductase (ferredoxin)